MKLCFSNDFQIISNFACRHRHNDLKDFTMRTIEEHTDGFEQQVSTEEERRTAHAIHKGWECFRRELQQRNFL